MTNINAELVAVLERARHTLVAGHNYRVTDLDVETFEGHLKNGVPRDRLEFMTDYSADIEAIDAALARAKGVEEDADGWIEWSGGVNPVGSHVVAVKYRNGEIEVQDGRRFGWDHWHEEVSGLGGYDIIAYRLAALQEPGHG